MKKILAAGFILVGGFVAFAPALAAGGCGAGWHRGRWGHCRPNGVVVAPAAVTVAPAVAVAPAGGVVYAPVGAVCPAGYHLGPQGRRCWPN